MSAPLGNEDFEQLEAGLTALRTAKRNDNSKGSKLAAWFNEKTGRSLAVSYITDPRQVGNRLQEQLRKHAPYTVFFSDEVSLSDRTVANIHRYDYPELDAVFFFVSQGDRYQLRTVARTGAKDDFVDQIVDHYQQTGSVTRIALGGSDDLPPLSSTDPIWNAVQGAMIDRYAGVILVGPPGTGKSRYAAQIAMTLAGGDTGKVRFVQFHPSYQYEDFVQGYVPNGQGFEVKWKVFGQLCIDAKKDPDGRYILVIDEFSRVDTARVFGEALTYIEMDKRGRAFTISSGDVMSIPPNIFIIATMNPWDRGVDDVDVALERRFAEIAVSPSVDGLRAVIGEAALEENVREGLVRFFEGVQSLDNQYCHIGHAYFLHANDKDSLSRLWDCRLHPFFRRACRSDKAQIQKIENMWRKLVAEAIQPPDQETEVAEV